MATESVSIIIKAFDQTQKALRSIQAAFAKLSKVFFNFKTALVGAVGAGGLRSAYPKLVDCYRRACENGRQDRHNHRGVECFAVRRATDRRRSQYDEHGAPAIYS